MLLYIPEVSYCNKIHNLIFFDGQRPGVEDHDCFQGLPQRGLGGHLHQPVRDPAHLPHGSRRHEARCVRHVGRAHRNGGWAVQDERRADQLDEHEPGELGIERRAHSVRGSCPQPGEQRSLR